ncbi:MAG: FHA domain-containing protein [Planctomycetes bacterium]|nr:FHA domain-containing protein [Planctomycetota bacterium]
MRFIFERDGKRFEYTIPDGNMIVGRDRKCDVAIVDNSISRHHITVARRDTKVTIRDLGSRNGTFVNNSRVTEAQISPGDLVRLGNITLFFDDGSPGLTVPTDLERHLARGGRVDETPTPPEGTPAAPAPAPGAALPPAPFQAPAVPAPAPGAPPGAQVVQRNGRWFLRDPATGREVEYAPPGGPPPAAAPPGTREAEVVRAVNLPELAARAKSFYLARKKPVLIALAALTALLLAVAAARVFTTPPPKSKKAMPLDVYDKFLDDGVDAFALWIAANDVPPKKGDREAQEKRKKDLASKSAKARQFFETIQKHVPERQTAGVLLDLMDAWGQLQADMAGRDWSAVQRYLDDLVSHPNVTPRAKEFCRERLKWISVESNSRAQARRAMNAFRKWEEGRDLKTLQEALDEFKRLERDFAGTPAWADNAERVPAIHEEFRRTYEEEGDRRFERGEYSTAIESFEKAKGYAADERLSSLDAKISKARFLIDQSRVLPEAYDLKNRGEWERLIDLLKNVPAASPAYAEAQQMMREGRYQLLLQKLRDGYRRGDAASVDRLAAEKEFFSDPEVASFREKSRRIGEALAAGDAAYEAAMKQIREMEDPEEVKGFGKARASWGEVKNLEGDPGNAFVAQAERRLNDLTDEKIGSLFYEKAQALLAKSDFRKGRDFLDLARKFDGRLGAREIAEWKKEASRKYNEAINLIGADKAKAREILTWILSVLRPGDSEYFEKAQKALVRTE